MHLLLCVAVEDAPQETLYFLTKIGAAFHLIPLAPVSLPVALEFAVFFPVLVFVSDLKSSRN